ncbi:DUF2971 domain-containing protein [Pseudoduganella sp. FT55W]|uniref:DUF2971 domain-containing protein n=1 Tax=Duganella rivi TaxID=2666083 RepID=A0A7X4GMR0_9BURK|nr:DUF2971 domain-containing protein [Duganella rivi]MYM66243.1 DUF2971 domain-containing protein [Duganella rivi]
MRLYYMTSLDTAVEYILPERRLRLAQFEKLNDPFELMSVRLEGPKGRAAYRILRQHWSKRLGIICTGQHWRSPVMWAHYARSHTGVCLGFDVQDDMAKKVTYTQERKAIKLNPKEPYHGLTLETLEELLTTKYSQWAYEEEWRLFSNLDKPDPNNGEYYLPFGSNLALREIIIGARCKRTAADFDKILGPVDKTIRIAKARPAFETFTMVEQQRFKPVFIKPRP